MAAVSALFLRAADLRNFVNETIHFNTACQKRRHVAVIILIILMQRKIIDVRVAVLQHSLFPCAEGRHASIRAAARDQLNRWIEPLHHLRGFAGDSAVFLCGLCADLPRAVHLVAKTPELHVIWRIVPICTPKIGILRRQRTVDILQ